MKSLLIVGSGGREHALAWKLRQSAEVGRIYVAPGNAGTALVAENVSLAATDLSGIVRFVEERDVGLVVVGPEAPLALGLADRLRERGRRVVGPNAAAARIEASKSFAKEIMARAGVPTARFAVFDRADAALRHLKGAAYPLAVKADGLAAGKGVALCSDEEEARRTVRAFMIDRIHGRAGERLVVEEVLSGPEVSLLALVDGERVAPLPLAQDHKRLGDGDTGPNTGGMGAYAPIPFVSPDQAATLSCLILEPVVACLADLGTPYRGVLFAGLMLTEDGPRVLEFNCRFGDPEAQAILPLLADDLLPWLEAVAGGDSLALKRPIPTADGSAVGVVLAAPGYPDRPRVGALVEGPDEAPPDVLVFHAGTARDGEGRVVTAGGRVLTVVGRGSSIEEAASHAYAAPIRFEGMQRRSDLGWGASPHPPTPSPAKQGRGRTDGQILATGDVAPLPREDVGAPLMGALPRVRVPAGEAPRLAVLASGEGSNLQAILDACRTGSVDARVAAVISANPGAQALERARRAGVPAIALPVGRRCDPVGRRRHEAQVLEALRSTRPD
ncbi:MAG: phosphoribosylamine--glycine ligase, partial [Chloroflexi bacterium]|nr:phosphoribosylamine--glycine ligase [Chloroflexota bacterium]